MGDSPLSPPGTYADRGASSSDGIGQDLASKWNAMAEFDAAEAGLAQVQTRPLDTVRAEEEELLENRRATHGPRGRMVHPFPSSNRLATGGLVKPKLSPEELAEKMEAMKLKNQRLVERRLRTEADENQYKEQEEARQSAQMEQRIKMKQKREDDSRIQKEIDNQREEIRRKKLGKALEWDLDKPAPEDDDSLPPDERFYEKYNRTGRDSNRGIGRETAWRGTRGRGNRGRNARGRYASGRGGVRSNMEFQQLSTVNDVPEEWPSLPTTDS